VSSFDIIVALRAAGQVAFKNAMDSSAKSIAKVDQSADKAGRTVDASGKKAKGAGKGWKSAVGSLGGWQTVAAGAAIVGVGMKSTISAASDLSEEVSKGSVVFGESGKSIVAWSKTTADALGLSQQQALAATGTLGNMLVPMGFARKDAAQMSQKMVTLAADMASFNNADPAETLDALRAGLAGETEPLRRFGVSLSDARLRQEALNMGIYKGKGPLDANTKAQATYALILKDTKDQQGDAARTGDQLAGRQRKLKAQFADLSATIGTVLLPVGLKLAQLLGFLMQHTEVVIPVVAAITAGWIAYSVAQMAAALAALTFNAAFLLIPIAVVAVVAALIVAYKKVSWFRDGVNWLWGAIKAVAAWLRANWKTVIIGVLTGPFGIAVKLIHDNWDKIKAGARSVLGWFKSFGSKLVSAIVNGIKAAPRVILDAIMSLLPGGISGKLAKGLAKVLPGFATGGVMYGGGGLGIVGERGPELMHLPGGTRITPLASSSAALASLGGMGANRQTVVYVQLDRRTIATAVANDTADRKARR
jgi:hypothetical protein